MELKLLNENGQEGAVVNASDVVFGRDYNEALIRSSSLTRRMLARVTAHRRTVSKSSTRRSRGARRAGRARAGMSSAVVAWRWSYLPELPEENSRTRSTRRCIAQVCSIFSQLAREGRLSVVEDIILEAPKTKLLAEKFKTMGLDSVLIITDTVDENLYLASRNLWRLSSRATLTRCR